MNAVSPVTSGHFATLASGQTLHYAQAGDKSRPLAIFLHGFPQAWFAWEAQLALSAQTHFCVAPDLRGFNLSDKPSDLKAYRIDRLVNDVVELIDALGYKTAELIAHDWGGAVAWSVAIARPDKLEHLMILNAPHPIPFAKALAHDAAQQAASQYMLELRSSDAEQKMLANDCDVLLNKFRAGDAHWLSDAVAQRYRDAWRQPGAMTGMLAYYRASPLMPPTDAASGAAGLKLNPADFMVTVPTTVIWGMQDVALLPVLLDGLEELVPDLTLRTVDNASHWLVHERPDVVAAEIETFLGLSQLPSTADR
ncbi:MAG: alpha/beta fold hydrolase [Burkholderiaceae bacterium]